MSYLVNEIYELYEKHLELTEPVLKDIGVDANIHNYLIDVNIDLEILLESNDLIKYDHDKLQEKIKEAYDEVRGPDPRANGKGESLQGPRGRSGTGERGGL